MAMLQPQVANKRIPINAFPPEVRQALAQTWDKENGGFVTIGELCAGYNGANSARNARQGRQIAAMGKARPTGGAPASAQKYAGAYTEMPGDFAALDSIGMAEGQSIWDRMAAIIRSRRLDMRILLDAHDRRNAGVVDVDTFRRALCYAFGNNWIELAITSAEFDHIIKPYMTRNPNNPGEPEGFVFWQKFATDLQTLADRRTHSDNFMARLSKVEAKERVAANLQKTYGISEYDLKKAFRLIKELLMLKAGSSSHLVTVAFRNMDRDHTGKIGAAEIKKYLAVAQRGNESIDPRVMDCIVDLCDGDGDGEVDYVELSKMILCDDIMELLALVPDKSLKSKSKEAESQVIGFRKVTAKELQQAQQAIKTKLLTKYPNITTALRKIDTKGDGYLSREEVKEMLRFNELLKRIDYYTGALHGSITEACADTLCDYVDKDRDGKLNYNEFARVLTADNILMIPAPKNPAARFGSGKFS